MRWPTTFDHSRALWPEKEGDGCFAFLTHEGENQPRLLLCCNEAVFRVAGRTTREPSRLHPGLQPNCGMKFFCHAFALGRAFMVSYQRIRLVQAGSRSYFATFAQPTPISKVMSAIESRLPATPSRSFYSSFSQAKRAVRFLRAISATLGVWSTRPAKNGLVCWKIVEACASTPCSQRRS